MNTYKATLQINRICNGMADDVISVSLFTQAVSLSQAIVTAREHLALLLSAYGSSATATHFSAWKV